MLARRDRLAVARCQAPGLSRGTGTHRHGPRPARRPEHNRQRLQFMGVQHDGVGGLIHLNVDRDAAGKMLLRRVELQAQLVARGPHLLGQHARRLIEPKARLRPGRRPALQRQQAAKGNAAKESAGHGRGHPGA